MLQVIRRGRQPENRSEARGGENASSGAGGGVAAREVNCPKRPTVRW